MNWCCSAWREITADIITNCFRHTNFLGAEGSERQAVIDQAVQEELCKYMTTLSILSEEEDSEMQDIHERDEVPQTVKN